MPTITSLAEKLEAFAHTMWTTFILCLARLEQSTLSKTYSAWFVAKVTGEVISGHCTCMAG